MFRTLFLSFSKTSLSPLTVCSYVALRNALTTHAASIGGTINVWFASGFCSYDSTRRRTWRSASHVYV